jgi:transposase
MTNIEEQISLYRQGLSYPQIAERTNTTAAKVQRSIRAWKLQPKQVEPSTVLAEQIETLRERIRSLRTDGQSMKAIGRQVGIEEIVGYRHLQIMGLL